MTSSKKFLIIYILIILLSFALVKPSLAARELEVPIPGLPVTTLPALPDYIAAIFQFALMVIGIICLGALIYGGFRYLTSAGSPSAMNDAKDQIFSALLGLIILFSAWLILNTINPELVILGNLNPTGCTSDADCPPGQLCIGGNADCPPGQSCAKGICSLFPGGAPPNGWSSCSSYFTSGDCTRNKNPNDGKNYCDWCAACSGTQINTWRKDSCVTAGTDCGYSCQQDYCDATSCQ